jgi:sec-independent protein translocase protein TatC
MNRIVPGVKKSPVTPPDKSVEPEEDGHELRMSLLDHILELRNRLVKASIAFGIGTIIGLAITEPVFYFLLVPLRSIGITTLATLAPTDSIVNFLRVSLLIGAIISIPMVTYQLLMFIVPGLTKKERRIVLSSLPAVSGLFLVGVAFAWVILIPPALQFLGGFQPELFKANWTADQYLGFVTALLFWMGVAFQTPLIFFVMSLLGFVGPGTLVKQWRSAVVGSAVAAAIITPTVDPVNLFLVMGPLLGLYVFSIFLVFLGSRRFQGAGTIAR